MARNRGQTLLFMVVLLPLLVILTGVIVRSGKAALVRTRAQHLCERIALDALAEQARGLQALGKLNPYARAVIHMRRKIDSLLAAAAVEPPLLAALLKARATLRKTQKIIEVHQKIIEQNALNRSLIRINKTLPKEYAGKLLFQWIPQIPTLAITKAVSYEMETGAPLELRPNFVTHQNISGRGELQTEKFLTPWRDGQGRSFQSMPHMTIECYATIKMKGIEAPWEALLAKAKPSWKRL